MDVYDHVGWGCWETCSKWEVSLLRAGSLELDDPIQWWFYDSMKYTILKDSKDENELIFTDQDTAVYGFCTYANYKYHCQQQI